MTIQFGEDDLAKYTFLPQAGDYITLQGISITDLANPDYKKVIERAEDRVSEAFRSGKVSDKSSENREIEIMSFPVSLMLVRSTKLDHIMERYALAEAIRVEGILKQEKNDRVIEDIFTDFLKIKLERSSESPVSQIQDLSGRLCEEGRSLSQVRVEARKQNRQRRQGLHLTAGSDQTDPGGNSRTDHAASEQGQHPQTPAKSGYCGEEVDCLCPAPAA